MRAARYEVRLLMRCRPRDGRWQEAETRNVSASGVLFEIASPGWSLDVNDSIEMYLFVPADAAGNPRARVVCSGRVTRVAPADGPDRSRVAATIERYRMERGDGGGLE